MTTATGTTVSGMRIFATDVIAGFLAITRNSFVLVGLLVVFMTATLLARPDLRQTGEEQLIGWLQARRDALTQQAVAPIPEPEPSERAMAVDPKHLPKEQAKVAYWLSKKYRVAPEPVGLLVAEAYATGTRVALDPTLILAVMAVESSFNPFAQSSVGAQGLMQVMTRVHTDKYERVGGQLAAFDPVTNLRVGVKVLMDCINRTGSVEGGLVCYVGASDLSFDGGYAAKVLAEHTRLRQIAGKRKEPPSAFPLLAQRKPVPPPEPKEETLPVDIPAVVEETEKVALLSDSDE